ncbi:hypothetical protein [Inhella sp.]|uniref:hypothetical protein n=1 Tax=Inhella sp. TaxID=1921806 RepID=UPI0035AFE60A
MSSVRIFCFQALIAILGTANAQSPEIDFEPLLAGGLPKFSSTQIEALTKEFNRPLEGTALNEGRASASNAILRVVRAMACSDSDMPIKDRLKDLLPEGRAGNTYISPKIGMKYHPAATCLSVQKTSDWRMEAKNAIAFRVLYNSDESGASKHQKYVFMRQPDGSWLLKSMTPW